MHLALNHLHSLVAHLDNDSINVHKTFCFNLVKAIVQSDVGTSTTNSSTISAIVMLLSAGNFSFTYLQWTTRAPELGAWKALILR